MPFYRFQCASCGARKRKMMVAGDQTQPVSCPCGATMERDPNPPSTQVMETLDNGVMARKVERLANAEQLFHERAQSDPRKNR